MHPISDSTDLTLTISSVQPRVTATTTVKVLSAKVDVEVKLDLEVSHIADKCKNLPLHCFFNLSNILSLQALSGTTLRETYVDMKVSTLNLPLSALPSKVSQTITIAVCVYQS